MNKYLILAIVAAIITIAGLARYSDKLRDENAIYKANQSALLSRVEYYQTENGKSAASVKSLTLSYDELKESYSNVCKVAKDLEADLKRAKSISTTTTTTKVEIRTEVRDSIIYRDSVKESVKIFRWDDPWVSILGELDKDSVDINVQSTDTIVQVVQRVPHKWWFFKWGTKAIVQKVVSTNPHTKIEYTEYIELK